MLLEADECGFRFWSSCGLSMRWESVVRLLLVVFSKLGVAKVVNFGPAAGFFVPGSLLLTSSRTLGSSSRYVCVWGGDLPANKPEILLVFLVHHDS